jgi:Predicted P-loop ATPase and inactivated derivatives
MATKAIICDDEFSGKSKQDYKMLKEIISKQNITLRRPFGRFAEDFQRIAVLCGCSNEPEIINDPTGNRRIIPIPLIEIDWEKYNAVDKTALWMELYHEWRQIGDGWMLTKEEVKLLNDLTTKAHQVATEEEAIWMFFSASQRGRFSRMADQH